MLMVAGFCFALRLYLALARPDLTAEDSFIGALQIRLFKGYPEIYGMFKLWAGEWWRIFVNPFYHLSVGHLFFNTVAMWMLAELLERRFGALRFAFFCTLACLVCSVPELLIEVEAFGLSGIVYAMFGALLILRNDDAELAERFGKWPITIGLVWLFLCIPLSASKLIPIANGAHFAGLLFGIVFTFIQFEISKYSRNFARLSLGVIMLVTWGLIYLAVNPTWLGRYHAWRSLEFPEEFLSRAERALELDPELPAMWVQVALEHERNRRPLEALQALLSGIKSNRTNAMLIEYAKQQWRSLGRTQRVQARQLIDQVFADEAAAFAANLGFQVPEFDPIVDLENLPLFGGSEGVSRGRIDLAIDLPHDVAGITKPLPPLQANGEVDPDDPSSARLGESL